MNTRSPRVWLIDIREEIAGIQGLTKEADIAAFSASWAMKRAVKHALLIIAEAAKNSAAIHERSAAHGLGNLLRHEYRHIDPEVLWSIETGPLGDLDRAAAALLEQLENWPPGR